MTDTAPKQVLHLRIPADLHEAITQLANETQRSVNGMATYLLLTGHAYARGTLEGPRLGTPLKPPAGDDLHLRTVGGAA